MSSAVDHDGWTALHICASQGHLDGCRTLLGDDRVIHPVDLDPLTEEEQVQQQDVDAEQRRQVEMDAAVDKVFRDVQ